MKLPATERKRRERIKQAIKAAGLVGIYTANGKLVIKRVKTRKGDK